VNEYPWIGSFASRDGSQREFCSSSLIAANWVITASHCFFDNSGASTFTADTLSIILGEHNFTDSSTDTIRKTVNVEKIILHPLYDASTANNDIALMKLSESVDLEVYTPVCLPPADADYTGKTGWVYGWGYLTEGGPVSDTLQELNITIISDAECNRIHTEIGFGDPTITDVMLCAGGEEGKDACAGDSGGPFSVEENNIHELAGVVSWGHQCAYEDFYGVYAEVAKFRTWIDQQMTANGGGVKCD